MTLETFQPWLIPTALVLFIFGKRFYFLRKRSKLPEAIAQGGVIVDVRSPGEFRAGSSQGSINISLGELEKRLAELDREKPVILCCASGARSGAAASLLRKNGFKNVVNAGPWTNTQGLGA